MHSIAGTVVARTVEPAGRLVKAGVGGVLLFRVRVTIVIRTLFCRHSSARPLPSCHISVTIAPYGWHFHVTNRSGGKRLVERVALHDRPHAPGQLRGVPREVGGEQRGGDDLADLLLSLIHISEPTRQAENSYAV